MSITSYDTSDQNAPKRADEPSAIADFQLQRTPLPKHKILKNFTHRKGKPYCIIGRDDGSEWLVESVLDNGRLMGLILCGTDGQGVKIIFPESYHRFHVILSPEDLNDA